MDCYTMWHQNNLLKVLVVCLLAIVVVGQQPDTTTLIVTTTSDAETTSEVPTTLTTENAAPAPKPKVSSLHYDTEIKHRYARTHVTSKISNPAEIGQQVHFQVTLPENAFISKFVMTIKDVAYEAYVKEKEEAKADYDAAVQHGVSAAHISLIDRDSNKFGVSVNVEAAGKILFNLTYEELLTRSLGHYTHIINVNPGQIVKDLAVKVKIQETSDITKLDVPSFKSTNDVTEGSGDNKLAKIVRNPDNAKEAEITWSPDYEQQTELAKDGLKGRLIIEYDVDRKQHASQILIEDGHFVHFFAPADLPPLRKQVVFVLDISGSMFGEKIQQLKDAMQKILSDLNPQDHFSIVLFSDNAYVWSKAKTPVLKKVLEMGFYNLDNETLAILDDHRNEILQATPDNIKTAKEFVELIKPTTSTNIIDGLRKGLKLVKEGKSTLDTSTEPSQPIMFFLTDGEPNVDLTDPVEIVNETNSLNEELKTPIYSLAFGRGADIQFLKKLSKANHGFARNIYEGSDATLQLNNFYKEISSPLLANVTFTYPTGDVDNSTITDRSFPIYFDGGELVVLGKVRSAPSAGQAGGLSAAYNIETKPGSIDLKRLTDIQYCYKDMCGGTVRPHPHPQPPLVAPKAEHHGEYVMYKFVTPLTSLVVVKPNETAQAVQPEKSDSKHGVVSAAPLSVKYAMAAYPAAPSLIAGQFPPPPPSGYPGIGLHPVSSFGAGGYSGSYLSMNAVPAMAPMAPMAPHAFGPPMPSLAPPLFPQYPPPIGRPMIGAPVEIRPMPYHKLKWLNITEAHPPTEEPVIELLTGNPPELHNYTVGINKTSSYFDKCTSVEGEGFCKHIEYCTLTAFEEDISQYQPYFCPITGQGSNPSQIYAGVCCPTRFVYQPPPPPISVP
ncbi:hypothetical protein LSTR_LSTR006601 [Laodelphax striatellus]|uniref:VWFA domain-containing protein n=1 Tax=Laodelphax striatellus TaxID=195883 RepID=A0A482WZV8_LAOST|nr:hypothetical protein LSTR_LSTR006601 [Laodelphax striatellus]